MLAKQAGSRVDDGTTGKVRDDTVWSGCGKYPELFSVVNFLRFFVSVADLSGGFFHNQATKAREVA